MLKKQDIVFEFYQGEQVHQIDGTTLEFRIYLKNLEGTRVYEAEFFAGIEDEISFDKIIDIHTLVDKIYMKNKETNTVIKELIVNDYASYAIIANDLTAIKQSLCFVAKNII